MASIESIIYRLKNIQIYSALLWAATILLCSYFKETDFVSSILITAAGMHVVLMSQAKTQCVK